MALKMQHTTRQKSLIKDLAVMQNICEGNLIVVIALISG